MNRVLVLGSPGSGKSTFARALQAKTGLPLVYLDCLFWNADKTTVPREVFLQRIDAALAAPQWIMDGDFASSLPQRLARCDTVFMLDIPLEDCLAGVRARLGKKRPDLPWVDEYDEEFFEYIRRWHAEGRAQKLRETLNARPDLENHIFTSHAEAQAYISTL